MRHFIENSDPFSGTCSITIMVFLPFIVYIYSHIAIRFTDTSDPILQINLLRTLALYARAISDAMVGG